MKLKTKRTLLAYAFSLFALCSNACWYNTHYYNDYVFAVNDDIHSISVQINDEGSIRHITYTVTNNIVVDLPLTVSMKLVTQNPIVIDNLDIDESRYSVSNVARSTKIDAALQYRILPNGEWVTVSNYSIDSGRIPESYPPATYLGRNNIEPKGIVAGQQFMVRLYVTDNAGWHSGNPSSLCTDAGLYTSNSLTYTVTGKLGQNGAVSSTSIEPNYDMGGGWYPHYVVTLTYSGHKKPVQ